MTNGNAALIRRVLAIIALILAVIAYVVPGARGALEAAVIALAVASLF